MRRYEYVEDSTFEDTIFETKEYPGVAFWIYGHYKEDSRFAVGRMVGDDEYHLVRVDGLKALSDDEFCPSCGQVGCTMGRL